MNHRCNEKQAGGEILRAVHSIRTEPQSEFSCAFKFAEKKIAMPARAEGMGE